MQSEEIRKRFLHFFEERGHKPVASASLVPTDATLLLTTAGMVQFKPYFLGEEVPPYRRATSVQKCFRTTDIDEIGKNTRHLTFFEMLGNFSFGDYFKAEACAWAWEFATQLGLDEGRLWVTVFETDDEAHQIWESQVGVPSERIIRRGAKENFWHMGVAGPCGPSSELLYDRGPDFGDTFRGEGDPNEERYLEIWNLVFMSHIQDSEGRIVADLPSKNIDTGAGLERIAAIVQNVPSAFETDVMAPLMHAAQSISGLRYGESAESDVSLRVLAEHGRAITFLISDGVLPSNEGRGYVLRRLIRRSVRHARLVRIQGNVLAPFIEATIQAMGERYTDLAAKADHIADICEREERQFEQTLNRGLERIEQDVANAKAANARSLSAESVFRLHDTYGFPFDLALEIASEEGLQIDRAGFESLMADQRKRARSARLEEVKEHPAAEFLGGLNARAGPSLFLGYEHLGAKARIIALLKASPGRAVQDAAVAHENESVDVIVDQTPFYPQGGGQVSDKGEIIGPSGRMRVEQVRYVGRMIVHRSIVETGVIGLDDEVSALVDADWRRGAERSHTATHMLHWILRETLGPHAAQAGSLVEPGRLRFDFSHSQPLDTELISEMERELNKRVMADATVRAFETTYERAMSMGAMALFGEKYGDHVRVVEVGEYSKELCAGTHVSRTGEVGVIKVRSESSVGAGLRRIEAYTGEEGVSHLMHKAHLLQDLSGTLGVEPDHVLEKINATLAEVKELQAEIAEHRSSALRRDAKAILASSTSASGESKIVVAREDGRSVDDLRKLASAVRDGLASGMVILGAAGNGKANIVAAATKDLVGRGISAQAILKDSARLLRGGAGGKSELAVAGGSNSSGIEEALRIAAAAANDALTGQ